MLAELEKRSKQAAAAASEWQAGGRGVALRLGQRVVHRGTGFRGVVVGWDAACCEDEEWVERSGAAKLAGGLKCAGAGRREGGKLREAPPATSAQPPARPAFTTSPPLPPPNPPHITPHHTSTPLQPAVLLCPRRRAHPHRLPQPPLPPPLPHTLPPPRDHPRSQPFYFVLVDVRDWSFDASQPPVAYVAQELLAAPELVDDGAAWGEVRERAPARRRTRCKGCRLCARNWPPPTGPLWALATRCPPQVYGSEELQHPYSYVLFLGSDAAGDLLPCRQLRDKYAQKRRDVYPPGADGAEGESEGGSGGGEGGGRGKGPGGPKIPGIDMSSLM
jgi:heat shock protein HspQ